MALPVDPNAPASAAAPSGRRLLDARGALALAAVVLFAALVRVPRLGTPAGMVFDEIYYAKAAQQILARVEVTEERTHPPLSKLIIAAGITLFGDGAVGWRAAGAAAGTALVAAVFILTQLLFRDRFVAAAAAFFVALDGLVLVESRIAKPDILLTLFLFISYAAFWQYLRGRADPPDAAAAGAEALHDAGGPAAAGAGRWLYLAGAAAGCAVATKWTAVVPLLVIPATLALLRGWGRITMPRGDRARFAYAFLLLPAAIYLLTYVPYFALGHTVREFVAHQASMYQFHAGLTEGHPYQSAWWSWPLLIRPIWYEYFEAAPQVHRGIVAIGNPILWWAGLPAFAYVAAQAVRTRSAPETFLVAGFLISYAQYAFISRALFLYHYLPALPFLLIGLAAALGRLRARVGAGPVLALIVLAAGWLVAYYPILTGVPLPDERIMRLMWFGSWI